MESSIETIMAENVRLRAELKACQDCRRRSPGRPRVSQELGLEIEVYWWEMKSKFPDMSKSAVAVRVADKIFTKTGREISYKSALNHLERNGLIPTGSKRFAKTNHSNGSRIN